MTAPSSQHPWPAKWIADGISKGIAAGPVVILKEDPKRETTRPFDGIEAELARLNDAHGRVRARLQNLIKKSHEEVGPEEAAIFEAHLMMIEDEEFMVPIRALIEQETLIPELAIQRQFQLQIVVFEAADSEYLRERALDLKDLESQLLRALDPEKGPEGPVIRHPSIVVATDLTPSQTLLLDRAMILGIVTERGGPTSHSAIIARTLGIPAISGFPDAVKTLSGIPEIAIDGREGSIFVVDSPACKKYFESRGDEFLLEIHGLQSYKGKPSVTHDQHAVLLMGNIGGYEDAKDAYANDAEGIGLFRTEFLFMGRRTAPTLEEQRKTYREVLSLMAPREVTIRTLDVGGDKPIHYIPIEKEENPFLGVRAIRYCFEDLPLFKTQIKAMLLANEDGNLSIMLPMVSRASEAKRARELIDECVRECEPELAREGRTLRPFKVGAMLEIPSLAFELRELKESMSFVSVGTNDLMQYAYAVDRMNPKLRSLYTPYTPGFLRLMDFLAREARDAGLELGICGELGCHEELLPLWVAMGFQKLSMTPIEVLSKRRLLSTLTFSACEAIRREVLAAKSGEEVKQILESSLR